MKKPPETIYLNLQGYLIALLSSEHNRSSMLSIIKTEFMNL